MMFFWRARRDEIRISIRRAAQCKRARARARRIFKCLEFIKTFMIPEVRGPERCFNVNDAARASDAGVELRTRIRSLFLLPRRMP